MRPRSIVGVMDEYHVIKKNSSARIRTIFETDSYGVPGSINCLLRISGDVQIDDVTTGIKRRTNCKPKCVLSSQKVKMIRSSHA